MRRMGGWFVLVIACALAVGARSWANERGVPQAPHAGVHPREHAGDAHRNNIGGDDMPEVGRYFINADSSDVVDITFERGDHVEMESPGEWSGSGVMVGRTYWGVFCYYGDVAVAKNRGARGTHLGQLGEDGRLRVHGVFTNRPWPPFDVTWTPLESMRTIGSPRRSITREELRRIPVDEQMRHPVWVPSQHPDAAQHDHPVWPPERGQADSRITPAGGAKDSTSR